MIQLGVGGILCLLINIVGRHIGLGMKGMMGECIYDRGGGDKARIVIHGRCSTLGGSSLKILACDWCPNDISGIAY